MKRFLSAALALALGLSFALHDSAHASPLQDHACAVCSVDGSAIAPDAAPAVLAPRPLIAESSSPAASAVLSRAVLCGGARAPPR